MSDYQLVGAKPDTGEFPPVVEQRIKNTIGAALADIPPAVPAGMSIAAIGDSLVVNGGQAMAVWTLAAPAAVGATTISVTAQAGVSAPIATDMTSDATAGLLMQIGSEWAMLGTQGAFSGTGPFTLTLTTGLANAHAAGEKVIGKPMTQSNNSMQPAFWAHLMSAGALRFAGTYGRGGWRPRQILDTYVPLIVQSKPTFALVMAGRNRDTAEGSLSVIETCLANTVKIWDALFKAGITPIAHTLPPIDGATAQQLSDDEWFNERVRTLATFRGMLVIDTRRLFVDPATGGWIAAYQGDGTHPSNAGRKAHGAAVWDALSKQALRRVDQFAQTNVLNNPIIYPSPVSQTNALKLVSGGTVTGSGSTSVIPSKWSVSVIDANGIVTTPDAPDGKGKSIKVSRKAGTSAGGTADATTITPSHNTASQRTTLVPGHAYRAMVKVKTQGLTASGGNVQIRVVNTGAGGTVSFGTFGPITQDMDGTLLWDFLCTAVQPSVAYFEVQVKGSVSTLAYDFEFWGDNIIDLTALGIQTNYPMLNNL